MVRGFFFFLLHSGGVGGINLLCQASAESPQMVVSYKLQYNAKMQQHIPATGSVILKLNLLVCYNVKTSKQVLVSLECIGVGFPCKTKQNIQLSLLPALHCLVDVILFLSCSLGYLVYASHGKVSITVSCLYQRIKSNP